MTEQERIRKEFETKGCFPLQDPVLEEQCKRRGIHMGYLTVMGNVVKPNLSFFEDLHRTCNDKITDSNDNLLDMDEMMSMRMLWWSIEAANRIELFNEKEFAEIERAVQLGLHTHAPLTQEMFEEWLDRALNGSEKESWSERLSTSN